MSYPGMCVKFGPLKVMSTAIFGPAVIWGVGAKYVTESSAIVSGVQSAGFLVGAFGFAVAIAAHELTDAYLRHKNVGLTRGSKLVRRNQCLAYGFTVASFSGFLLHGLSVHRADMEKPHALIIEPAGQEAIRKPPIPVQITP